jgi:hypothetical protein
VKRPDNWPMFSLRPADEVGGVDATMSTTNGQQSDTITRHGRCIVSCG